MMILILKSIQINIFNLSVQKNLYDNFNAKNAPYI